MLCGIIERLAALEGVCGVQGIGVNCAGVHRNGYDGLGLLRHDEGGAINAAGFDSTVTLHLTVNHSSDTIVTIYACDSLVWHGLQSGESVDASGATTVDGKKETLTDSSRKH